MSEEGDTPKNFKEYYKGIEFRMTELEKKLESLRDNDQAIENNNRINDLNELLLMDYKELKGRIEKLENAKNCQLWGVCENQWVEIKELKNTFDCHFRADKDYDLRYSKQIKELDKSNRLTHNRSCNNKGVLREFMNIMQIDEPVGDIQQEIRELMKKLGGEKPLRIVAETTAGNKLGIAEEDIEEWEREAYKNPSEQTLGCEIDGSSRKSSTSKNYGERPPDATGILVEKADLEFTELRKEIETLIEYVDEYTHITPSYRAIQLLNDFKKKYMSEEDKE